MVVVPEKIWTIGHSSRAIEEFLDLLAGEQIEVLADVRRFPGSRAHPHFNPEPLAGSLAARDTEYIQFTDLGGRRKAKPDTPHTIWRHPAFRGYADYMDTEEFEAGLERLMETARSLRTAIMCSEAVWWRCHRSMISDALKARGVEVLHIMGPGKTTEHPFTAPARIVDGELYYGPAEE
ncbi:MAG TPA: DUF488 domain-containing protein [Longimicrobiaceae bacterium]|nr:DUF488 domain-containing protein [Longimicrobiaceae bacterium]